MKPLYPTEAQQTGITVWGWRRWDRAWRELTGSVIQEWRCALGELVIQFLTGPGDKGTAAPQYQQLSDLQQPAQPSGIGYYTK